MRSRMLLMTPLLTWPLFGQMPAAAADAPTTALSAPAPDTAKVCEMCEQWNMPQKPFQVFGNTYYVGTAELSVILITSQKGLILLDGALPQSVPQIEANIRSLGFKPEDVKWILSTHAHFDHAGGIAALARDTGARVGSSVQATRALKAGSAVAEDPQAGYGRFMDFAPVANVKGLKGGSKLRLGDVTITVLNTPGHTPGGASYTWRSCEADRCLQVVYADSLNPVSAPGFRYSGPLQASSAQPPAPPSALVQTFRQSIQTVETLPCDVLLTAHPGFSETFEKLEKRASGQPDAFIDSQSCRAYAADATRRLDQRLAEEAAPASP